MFERPPEGPNSGILVIEDEEAEAQARCCWGLCKNTMMSALPFPQNRKIRVQYSTGSGEHRRTHCDEFFFIPVVGQPLSSNCYHVIKARGKHKGKTCECSKEEDMSTFCLCTRVNDVKPSPFDCRNIYQQVEIVRQHRGRFHAKALALDGYPPWLLRRRGWQAFTSVPTNFYLNEALGVNTTLRAQMPNLKFPISNKYSPAVVVGKWYCPYIFIREDESVKDQMRSSMFYEMTLEQFWENIYTAENFHGTEGNVVEVGVSVIKEMPLLNGDEVVSDNIEAVDGIIWFKALKTTARGLGLSLPIWEGMKWEEERGGWVGSAEERVERVESYDGHGGWRMFGCFVLVERFVLKRMDGSLALTYDFRHTNKVSTRWE